MATFSERLKELRKENDITLQKLADDIGTTKSTISRYENNKREPKMYLIEKISDYFGVSTDYLLGNTDERTSADKLIEEYKKKGVEVEELLDRFNVRLDGKELTEEDKRVIISALRSIKEETDKGGA